MYFNLTIPMLGKGSLNKAVTLHATLSDSELDARDACWDGCHMAAYPDIRDIRISDINFDIRIPGIPWDISLLEVCGHQIGITGMTGSPDQFFFASTIFRKFVK